MFYKLSEVKGVDYIYIYLHKQKHFEKIYFEGIEDIADFLYRKYPKYSRQKYKLDSMLLYTGNSTIQTCLYYFDLIDGYIGYSEMAEKAETMFKKEWGYIDKIYTIKAKHARERGYIDYVALQCIIKAKIQYMDLAIVQLIIERKEEGDWSWNKKKEVVEALVHVEDLEVYTNTGAPRFKEKIEEVLNKKEEPPKKPNLSKTDTDTETYSTDDEIEDLYQSMSKQMGIRADRIEARTIGNIYTMGDPDPKTRGYCRHSHGSSKLMTWDSSYYEMTDASKPITCVEYGNNCLTVAAGTTVDDIRASMVKVFPELRNASAKQEGNTLYFYANID